MSNRPNPQVTSRPHGAVKKNPLHPSALRPGDLTPGRRIVVAKTTGERRDEFIVVGRPYVRGQYDDHTSNWHEDNRLKIRLRRVDNGETHAHFLSDLGIIPYEGDPRWNPLIYVVDVRKVHLLPALDPAQSERDTLLRKLGTIALHGYPLE